MNTRVLLIGWDGADWRFISPLLEAGLMPNLQALVERGVMGNLTSLQPMLSPLLWTSVATGKYADAHGVLGFVEPDAASGGVRPVRGTSRRCKALWNVLSEQGRKVGVIHWLASHPAEQVNGFMVSDRFLAPAARRAGDGGDLDAVWPRDLAQDLLPVLVGPADVTPRQLYPFVNVADEEVLKGEQTGKLAWLLSQSASTQALATLLMQTEEWDFLAVYQEGIDRFAHAFMDYHPPRRPGVSEEDFERYRHVMNGCYRFHDMMLGRLVELAGEDTLVLVVSDHGFHSDQLRPEESPHIEGGQPVAWHRQHGMLAAAGPGVREDELIFGAGLLDIAPTVLAALGVPVPDDMPGEVLTQLWPEGAVSWETTDTHEEEGWAPAVADGSEDEEDPWVAAEMLRRLADLGYIEDDRVERAVLERERNLGIVYATTGRAEEALAQFERVLEQAPGDLATKLELAGVALRAGRPEIAHRAAEDIMALHPEGPGARLMLGRVLLLEGDAEGALEHLLAAEQTDPRLPDLHINLGWVHLRREAWADAERAFARALEIDPLAAAAHNGLGMALRRQGRAEEAVEAHMQAVSLLHHAPEAHLQLALALVETRQVDWAIRAFEVAARLDPGDPRPHAHLAELYRFVRPDADRALHHEEAARRLLA